MMLLRAVWMNAVRDKRWWGPPSFEVSNARYWPKADIAVALHMSAYGGKADISSST
jgi:hypothetical protein